MDERENNFYIFCGAVDCVFVLYKKAIKDLGLKLFLIAELFSFG